MTIQIHYQFQIVPCKQNNKAIQKCGFPFCALPLITLNFHIVFRGNVTFSLKTKFFT